MTRFAVDTYPTPPAHRETSATAMLRVFTGAVTGVIVALLAGITIPRTSKMAVFIASFLVLRAIGDGNPLEIVVWTVSLYYHVRRWSEFRWV